MSWLGCSQHVLVFSPLLRHSCCKYGQFLLVWRHLAGLVKDDKEDEDEDTDRGVTNNGRNGPQRQSHPQIVLHGRLGRQPPEWSHQSSEVRLCRAGHLSSAESHWKCIKWTQLNKFSGTHTRQWHTWTQSTCLSREPTLWWGQLGKDYFLSDELFTRPRCFIPEDALCGTTYILFSHCKSRLYSQRLEEKDMFSM